MEDLEEEWWEYEEYYNISKEDLKESNFSWLLRKGLSLGKKAVITGVVISSAPFVLPPLAVISLLGFAVSVPAGVVIASYACTEKIMSKLLPIQSEFSFIILEEEGDSVGQFEVEENVIQPCVDDIKYIETRGCESRSHVENSRQEDAKELSKGVVVSKLEADKNIGNTGEVIKKKRIHKRKLSKSCLKMSHGVGKNEEYKPKIVDHITSANEVVRYEKNLWDKVDVLRLIVGYNAARRQSLSEELWGLYMFIGVKPPSSFETSIEEKLYFLMSIIGVK